MQSPGNGQNVGRGHWQATVVLVVLDVVEVHGQALVVVVVLVVVLVPVAQVSELLVHVPPDSVQ